MRARTVLSIVLVTCAFATERVSAQRRPIQARARPVRSGGSVVAMRPGLLEVKTATGDSWLLKVDARGEKVSVAGTADRSFLRPGMLVRFTAELTKKGETTEPIKQLAVFTPRPGYGLGLLREPGSDQQNAEPPARGKRNARSKLAGTYLVAGRLSGIKNNVLQVSAQRRNVRGELAEDVKIDVDVMGDYSMIRPGDEVEFTGSFLQKGKAIAKSLKFTATKPFSRPQRKARGARRPKRVNTREAQPADDTSPKEQAGEDKKQQANQAAVGS